MIGLAKINCAGSEGFSDKAKDAPNIVYKQKSGP